MQIINNDGNSGIYAYDDQCPPNYSGNYPRNYIENGANNFSENTENLYSQNTNQKYENSYTHHLPKISTSNIFQAAQNLEDLKNGNMRPSNNDSENSFPQFSNIALNPNFESTSFPIPPYMNNIKRDCSSLSGNINDTKTGDLNNEHNTTAFNSGILNNYDTTRNVIMSVNKDLEKKKMKKKKKLKIRTML